MGWPADDGECSLALAGAGEFCTDARLAAEVRRVDTPSATSF